MTMVVTPVRIAQKLGGFFLPGGGILLAILICVRQGVLTPWLPQINQFVPYVILGTGFLLGWRFHRGRLAYVILLLILTDRVLHYFGPGGRSGFGAEQMVLHTSALLLPVNLLLFSLVKERGIFNFRGLLRLLFIFLQVLLGYFFISKRPELIALLDHSIITTSLFDRVQLPQLILLVHAAALVTFLVSSLYSNSPVQRGFFWSMLTVFTALAVGKGGSGATIYFSAAGLIMILAMIESAYAMAYHDELTGLPARRSLNTTLQNLGRRYAIAMLDIDFFKKFNDRYGHDVGDQVLCMVASHINQVGGGGKPFRYGGEEFTVVFPGKSKKEVIPYLETLRESIAGAQFGLRGKGRPKKKPKKRSKRKSPKTVSVTISIGVAEAGPKLTKPVEVIKAADRALYRAKKKGRNCVV